jgi:NADP-dependent 3-hydroxy acid dehydrogenase YdfG
MNRKTRESQDNFEAIDPREYSTPKSVAAAVRLVIDTSDDTQITDIAVRPRRDKAKR